MLLLALIKPLLSLALCVSTKIRHVYDRCMVGSQVPLSRSFVGVAVPALPPSSYGTPRSHGTDIRLRQTPPAPHYCLPPAGPSKKEKNWKKKGKKKKDDFLSVCLPARASLPYVETVQHVSYPIALQFSFLPMRSLACFRAGGKRGGGLSQASKHATHASETRAHHAHAYVVYPPACARRRASQLSSYSARYSASEQAY